MDYKCPKCGSTRYSVLTVVDIRAKNNREIQCSDCAHEGTYEEFAEADNPVDPATVEEEALTRGLHKALEDKKAGRSPTFEEIAAEMRQEREPH